MKITQLYQLESKNEIALIAENKSEDPSFRKKYMLTETEHRVNIKTIKFYPKTGKVFWYHFDENEITEKIKNRLKNIANKGPVSLFDKKTSPLTFHEATVDLDGKLHIHSLEIPIRDYVYLEKEAVNHEFSFKKIVDTYLLADNQVGVIAIYGNQTDNTYAWILSVYDPADLDTKVPKIGTAGAECILYHKDTIFSTQIFDGKTIAIGEKTVDDLGQLLIINRGMFFRDEVDKLYYHTLN